jgi:uncharacterized protein (DUF488 family)
MREDRVTLPFFTVGHSNRSLDDFLALLAPSAVARLVDIRTVPRSRANPQFDGATLPPALAGAGIAYEHAAALGGLRGRSRDVPPEVNGFWTNESFHNYADHALSAEFRAALDALIATGRRERCAVMCSEAVWWRCHRRIVADHLIARGETVLHLMQPGRADPATFTPGAVVRPDRSVVYPAP